MPRFDLLLHSFYAKTIAKNRPTMNQKRCFILQVVEAGTVRPPPGYGLSPSGNMTMWVKSEHFAFQHRQFPLLIFRAGNLHFLHFGFFIDEVSYSLPPKANLTGGPALCSMSPSRGEIGLFLVSVKNYQSSNNRSSYTDYIHITVCKPHPMPKIHTVRTRIIHSLLPTHHGLVA